MLNEVLCVRAENWDFRLLGSIPGSTIDSAYVPGKIILTTLYLSFLIIKMGIKTSPHRSVEGLNSLLFKVLRVNKRKVQIINKTEFLDVC